MSSIHRSVVAPISLPSATWACKCSQILLFSKFLLHIIWNCSSVRQDVNIYFASLGNVIAWPNAHKPGPSSILNGLTSITHQFKALLQATYLACLFWPPEVRNDHSELSAVYRAFTFSTTKMLFSDVLYQSYAMVFHYAFAVSTADIFCSLTIFLNHQLKTIPQSLISNTIFSIII